VGGEAGVGDGDIQPPERADRRIGGRADSVVVGGVRDSGQQTVGAAERGGESGEPVGVASGNGDAVTRAQQASGGCGADAAGTPVIRVTGESVMEWEPKS
jgi:hypothetical protein